MITEPFPNMKEGKNIHLSDLDSSKKLPSIKAILHQHRRMCVWQWKELLDFFVFGCGHIVGWVRQSEFSI